MSTQEIIELIEGRIREHRRELWAVVAKRYVGGYEQALMLDDDELKAEHDRNYDDFWEGAKYEDHEAYDFETGALTILDGLLGEIGVPEVLDGRVETASAAS